MEITHARDQSDLQEIADLKGKIFKRATYYEFFEERMRFHQMDPWFKPEHALIIRENGKIVSQVTIFDRPVRMGPVILKMGGIGDVLTVPEYRGKGYSRLLMNSALAYMQNNHFDLTMLFGIPNYYHRFGYIEAMNYYQLEFLNPNFAEGKFCYQVREFTMDDLPAMCRLYQRNIRDCHLVIDRTIDYFKSKISQPAHLMILVDTANQVAGYAYIWDPIGDQFAVIEAISHNQLASFALVSEIWKRKPNNAPSFTIKMSPRMPFIRDIRYLGTELRTRSFGEGEGKGMLAIIDLCQYLDKLTPLLSQRMAVSKLNQFSGQLEIKSRQSVKILFEKGVAVTCQPAEKSSNSHLKLVTDFRYFARNVVGYWSIQDLLDQTDAQVNRQECAELLKILFPETDPCLLPWDSF